MSAIGNAKQINSIEFDVFTGKLITNTFDALVSANVRQMESYRELLKDVGSTLKDFINNTSDSISDAEIVNILDAVLPGKEVKQGSAITSDELGRLNGAVEIKELGSGESGAAQPGPAEGEKPKKGAAGSGASDPGLIKANNTVAVPEGSLAEDGVNAIYKAVANRLAANRYDLLQSMVKAGMLRLVVDNGEILTRITFDTYENATNTRDTVSTTHRRSGASLKAGLVPKIFGACGQFQTTAIRCSTAKESHIDRSGTSVNIFGQVRINFHTDYMPLNS